VKQTSELNVNYTEYTQQPVSVPNNEPVWPMIAYGSLPSERSNECKYVIIL
jgi:hypothetical protein